MTRLYKTMTILKAFAVTRVSRVLAALLCAMNGMAAASGGGMFELNELSPGVYFHQGQHLGTNDHGRDDIANIGFIMGEDCIAVLDTGGSVTIGRAFREAIRAISDLPICYVINTHIHFDHILGNAAFREEGASFVGHAGLAAEMAQSQAFFLSEFADELGTNVGPESLIAPDIGVAETLQLDLGNRRLTLTAHSPAHSYTDLSIYDEQSGTLWLADLLFVDRLPTLDGSLKGWLATLEQLPLATARRVVPGHGAVPLSGTAALTAQQRYLELLLRETRQALDRGMFMEEAIETIGQQEQGRWLLYDQTHKRNVIKAFRELEWE